jgi:hypothetical protein
MKEGHGGTVVAMANLFHVMAFSYDPATALNNAGYAHSQLPLLSNTLI